MRSLFLPFLILASFLAQSQTIITEDIVSITTKEKNSKTILFSKKINNSITSFVVEAENQTSNDYSQCKWVSNISDWQLRNFIDQLVALDLGSSFECSLFHIVNKKDKIRVKLMDTKCTSEHKTHYFQKSCNRTLQFLLFPEQISLLQRSISKHQNNRLVKK